MAALPTIKELESLAFEHDGMHIHNPFLSECGRFSVDPVATYGFAEIDTGGGCRALIKALPNDYSLWLTDEGGIALPKADGTGSTLVGLYSPDGDARVVARLDHIEMATQDPDAYERLRAGEDRRAKLVAMEAGQGARGPVGGPAM